MASYSHSDKLPWLDVMPPWAQVVSYQLEVLTDLLDVTTFCDSETKDISGLTRCEFSVTFYMDDHRGVWDELLPPGAVIGNIHWDVSVGGIPTCCVSGQCDVSVVKGRLWMPDTPARRPGRAPRRADAPPAVVRRRMFDLEED